jgi:hypothetical protein
VSRVRRVRGGGRGMMKRERDDEEGEE